MNIITVAAGALIANFLTVVFLYALWRLTKNEGDMRAIGMVLAVCAVVIVIGLAGR